MSYQIVNWQGQTVYDEAEFARRDLEAEAKREGEPFTATVDCPRCGTIDVHWLDNPKLRPDEPTPLQMMQQSIHSMADIVSYGKTPRLYDPPGAVVARICTSCAYRWGQQ
jgi:hypothetical protein